MFLSFRNMGIRPLMVVCLTAVLLAVSSWSVTAAQDEPDPNPQPRLEIIHQRPFGENAVLTQAALEADEDTYLASSKANERFGSSTTIPVGYDNENGVQRVLLHFNLTDDLPDEAKTILTATLSLYMNSASPSLDPPLNVEIRRVDEPWSEVITNWNNAPDVGGLRGNMIVNRTTGFYEADVTSLVQDWFNGARENNGMMLFGDENPATGRERVFVSREGSSLFRPRLFIEYVDYEDSEPPVITVNPLPEYSPTDFVVSWSGSDVGESGIDYYDVQYSKDGGTWTDWQTRTQETSATFTLGEAGHTYDFRARGVDKAGNVEAYGGAEATTIFGIQAPQATVNKLSARQTSKTFTVSWTINTAGDNGISGFLLYYRTPGLVDSAWKSYTGVTLIPAGATSTSFISSQDTGYEFEIVAKGNGGLDETHHMVAEAGTMVDVLEPFIVPLVYLPVVVR